MELYLHTTYIPPGHGQIFLFYMYHVYTHLGVHVRVLIFNYIEFCDLVWSRFPLSQNIKISRNLSILFDVHRRWVNRWWNVWRSHGGAAVGFRLSLFWVDVGISRCCEIHCAVCNNIFRHGTLFIVQVQRWISCSILSQEFALLFDASWNLQHVCGLVCCPHFFLSLKFLFVSSHPWLPLGFKLNILQQVSTESRVSNLLLKISVQIQLVPFILKQQIYEYMNYVHLELQYTGLTHGLCVCTVFAIMHWKSPLGVSVLRCSGRYIVEHHTRERTSDNAHSKIFYDIYIYINYIFTFVFILDGGPRWYSG